MKNITSKIFTAVLFAACFGMPAFASGKQGNGQGYVASNLHTSNGNGFIKEQEGPNGVWRLFDRLSLSWRVIFSRF